VGAAPCAPDGVIVVPVAPVGPRGGRATVERFRGGAWTEAQPPAQPTGFVKAVASGPRTVMVWGTDASAVFDVATGGWSVQPTEGDITGAVATGDRTAIVVRAVLDGDTYVRRLELFEFST
jgi:hypothetical protein